MRCCVSCRALGDPDFKGPRELVVAEPDVARVVLKPGRDTFYVLGRWAGHSGLVYSGQFDAAVRGSCTSLV